jgi:hypothetical protein
MTTFMIAVVAMMVGAAVGFLTARLICGTASSVQRSPYMSWRGDMYRQRAADYRQRAADAKQRAAQEKDPSIKIAFEHEAAFWLGLAEQLDWNGRKEVSPQNVQRVVLRNSERRTMQAVQRHTAAQPPAQQGRARSATSADPY